MTQQKIRVRVSLDGAKYSGYFNFAYCLLQLLVKITCSAVTVSVTN